MAAGSPPSPHFCTIFAAPDSALPGDRARPLAPWRGGARGVPGAELWCSTRPPRPTLSSPPPPPPTSSTLMFGLVPPSPSSRSWSEVRWSDRHYGTHSTFTYLGIKSITFFYSRIVNCCITRLYLCGLPDQARSGRARPAAARGCPPRAGRHQRPWRRGAAPGPLLVRGGGGGGVAARHARVAPSVLRQWRHWTLASARWAGAWRPPQTGQTRHPAARGRDSAVRGPGARPPPPRCPDTPRCT